MVHRERARVDAILVGIGTVLADDPHLLSRARVASRRRTPIRAVLDPFLDLPLQSQLVRTAADGRVTVFTTVTAVRAHTEKAEQLRTSGVLLCPLLPEAQGQPLLRGVCEQGIRICLASLAADGASTVLCEGGARLLGALLAADLVDDAWVFTSSHALECPAPDPRPIPFPGRSAFSIVASVVRSSDRVEFWRRTRQGT